MHSYLALIRSLERGAFSVEYPDLPGCRATATSLPEARSLACALLQGHIQELRDSGVAPPPPRSYRELQDAGIADGAFPALVPVTAEG